MSTVGKVLSNAPCKSLADFKQLGLLGEGAYSAVYKVLRLADREMYALKKVKLPSLSDKEKQNALNEVRLIASIRHDSIISYKEAFFDDKTKCLCIVTEYADSGDLFQMITKHQTAKKHIPENDVWRFLHGMCQGLKALHDMKILHRDLKCANVFLHKSETTQEVIAKLGDFNVSKVAKRGLCMTQTGTPYYASPEVWRDMPYDAKSDMWSIGCVLYEMVALRPPFRAEDMEGLYRKVLRGQYPRIPAQYSHDLSEVIGVLLQVNPRHRPSVDQLLLMPVMRRHCSDGESPESQTVEDLLSTIKLPKNAIDLSSCLPKPQYDLLFGNLDNSPVPPSQESAGDIAGGTRARRNVGRGSLGQSQQQPPPPPLLPLDEVSRAGGETQVGQASPGGGYQDSLDAYLRPQDSSPQGAGDNFNQQGAATVDLAPRQAPTAGRDSLDDYLTNKNRLPPPRRPSGERSSEEPLQDPIAAAAQLRASANPRGLRGIARLEEQQQQQQQQADYGAGRGEYGGGRAAPQPQYNAYPSLPAPVPRYSGEYPPEDPRVRASPSPSSHAGRGPPPGMYGGREQYARQRREHPAPRSMASYARPQYALSSANALPQQPAARSPSGGGGPYQQPAARAPSGGGGGLRLPRIFTKS